MKNTKISKINIVIFVLIFIVSEFSPEIKSFSFYIIIPLLFIFHFFCNPNLLFKNRSLFTFFILIIWSSLTIVNSININNSIKEIWYLLSVLVLSFIITSVSYRNKKNISFFYILYIFYFFVLVYRAYILGLTSIDIENEGFNKENINANYFGYYGYMAIISSFFLVISYKKFYFSFSKYLSFSLFAFISFVSIISNFYSASRAGTLFSFITFLLFIYVYFFIPLNIKKTILLVISFICLYLILSHLFENLFQNSFLEKRFNSNIYEEARFNLLKQAIKIGYENFLMGVGPGNFLYYTPSLHYSHSTYFEIFANNGIIGILIFLYLFYDYIKKNILIIRLSKNRDKDGYYFLIFIITFIIYNFFYVFHISLFLMTFFFLVRLHLEIKTNQLIYKINEK